MFSHKSNATLKNLGSMKNPKLSRHMLSQKATSTDPFYAAQSIEVWSLWLISRKCFKWMLWFKCHTLSYFLKRCSFWTEWVSFIFFYHQNTLRRFFCPKLFGRIKNRIKIVIAGWIKEILSEKNTNWKKSFGSFDGNCDVKFNLNKACLQNTILCCSLIFKWHITVTLFFTSFASFPRSLR